MADQPPGGAAPSPSDRPGTEAPARPDRPFVVEPERASQRRRSRLPAALLVGAVATIAILSAWGLLGAHGPTPMASPVAEGPSSPPAAVAPVATLQRPAPDGAGLPSVDAATDDDAFAVLAIAGGWRQCPMWRGLGGGGSIRAVDGDAALAQSGPERVAGMHEAPDAAGASQRFWVGGSEDDAARGFGGTAVVRVANEVWTAIPDGLAWQAVRLEPLSLASTGLPAWQVGAHAYPAPYCTVESVGGQDAEVIEVPGDADPLERLFAQSGWIVCRTWQRMGHTASPDVSAIDAAADAAGAGDGPAWVTTAVPASDGTATREIRLLIDPDPAHAATQHSSRLVVVGSGEPRVAWIEGSLEGRPLAVSFEVVRTPGGRTAWIPTGQAAGVVGDCPTAVESPDGGREPPAGSSPDAADALPAVELLRGVRSASALLRERLEWTGCRMLALEAYGLAIPGAAIDRAAVDAGIDSGPLLIGGVGAGTEPVLVFLAEDVVDLARWAGMPVVALDGRPLAWLGDETRADEWQPILTPAGRTAWMQTGAAAWPDGGCDPPPDATPAIAGVRSLTCWTDRNRCLEAIEIARAIAPDAFTPSTEVAAGLGQGCPPGTRCAWTGPNDPVLVTAAPAGWASPDMVRMFTTGLRRLSGTSREVAAADVTPTTLAIASRPAAALPVPDPVDLPAADTTCTGDTMEGVLRGSPWDLRIAWLASAEAEIRWPGGFAAAFVPDLQLLSPDATDVAVAGDRVRLTGMVGGVEGGRFDACAVSRSGAGQP